MVGGASRPCLGVGGRSPRVGTSGSAPFEQNHDVLMNGLRGLKVREVSTSLEHDEAPARHRLRDMGSECYRDEVVLTMEDQRRNLECLQLANQVVSVGPPGVVIESLLDRPRSEHALLGE